MLHKGYKISISIFFKFKNRAVGIHSPSQQESFGIKVWNELPYGVLRRAALRMGAEWKLSRFLRGAVAKNERWLYKDAEKTWGIEGEWPSHQVQRNGTQAPSRQWKGAWKAVTISTPLGIFHFSAGGTWLCLPPTTPHSLPDAALTPHLCQTCQNLWHAGHRPHKLLSHTPSGNRWLCHSWIYFPASESQRPFAHSSNMCHVSHPNISRIGTCVTIEFVS